MYTGVLDITGEDFIQMHEDGELRFIPRAAKFPLAKKSAGGWILIYAPWCGHCRDPEWQALYCTLNNWLKKRGFHCYVMDATIPQNSRWVDKIRIPGFPFLFVYDKLGNVYAYEGKRTLKAMVKAMVNTLFIHP